jgi:hypothetical protein
MFSVIPTFGVLTHKDEVDRSGVTYRQQEREFLEGLGLQENRFLLCTAYCDAYDKHVGRSRTEERHPELDIPILKFMRQVLVYLFVRPVKRGCSLLLGT